MSGQNRFQLVSAGKTLRARAPEEVLRNAAREFSIPLSQARRLLIKGWVIKDDLSSQEVLVYRFVLHKIGLKVEVFPAGRYDNRTLLARIQSARQQRVAQSSASARTRDQKSADSPAPTEPLPAKVAGEERARKQLESLFADESPALQESVAEKVQLVLGLLPAVLVPGFFILLLVLCIYAVLRALWQIPQSMLSGEVSVIGIIISLLTAVIAVFVAAVFIWPYICAKRLALQPSQQGKILQRSEARGLYLLLEVLAQKTGLPVADRIVVTAGAEVLAEPGLIDIFRQRLPLSMGLAAARSLSGGEVLALIARLLGIYRGFPGGIVAWLVLDSARRLQEMQWALENGHNIVAPHGEPGRLGALHTVLSACGGALLPLVDRLCEWHRSVTGLTARQLERRGDAWAAQIVGSENFADFAEKWHQLIHAELVVSEINREASVSGLRLRDYPDAVHWMLSNLDAETRSNIELAMGQASDAWDITQAPDNERVAWAGALNLQPLVQKAFSVYKLLDKPGVLAVELSAAVAAAGTRPVENRRLLCTSGETERAQQMLAEYFNQLPPRRFLPLELPAGEDIRAMDLQAAIDWLRGKLVELRELKQRCDDLRARSAAIQLGAGLLRIQQKIDPQEYFLTRATPAAADESIRENRAQRGEVQQQIARIYSVFYLRLVRALETLPSTERRSAQGQLKALRAYSVLSLWLDKLENSVDILSLMIDRLALQPAERDLVQKYFTLTGQQLEGLFAAVESSEVLCGLGLNSVLQERLGRVQQMVLPPQRQGLVDALQAMELRGKSACAIIYEHYRVQLAQLLECCLKREQALKVRPLRLVKQL